jgi:poly-gamma-glutamate system protein
MPMPMMKNVRRSVVHGTIAASIVSLGAFAADMFWARSDSAGEPVKARAARSMESALEVIREYREKVGPPIDLSVDPNKTGLIGLEYSEITTTLGDLEAKRTTTNPDMGSLLVELFEEAGLGRGDRVAVGCSGSFPGLFVAMLAAANAMEIEPVIVISLGSSAYGANRLDFTLLDVSRVLNRAGLLPHSLAGVSLGGSGDSGSEFEPEVKELLVRKILSAGVVHLRSESLREAVDQRMDLYGLDSAANAVKAFVNIGGSFADMGSDPWVLEIGPGVHRSLTVPATTRNTGVLLAMARRGIPVIHLLYIRGLVQRYRLPWDPVPFTGQGTGGHGSSFWAVLILYLGGLVVAFSLVPSLLKSTGTSPP